MAGYNDYMTFQYYLPEPGIAPLGIRYWFTGELWALTNKRSSSLA